ncbi:hypothetical protein C6499_19075 [Candidatus Poribacteria bacterium]|nr:MAG: hypothetical protein C6499_19075 [Candidatus Poribacteria bacterium]
MNLKELQLTLDIPAGVDYTEDPGYMDKTPRKPQPEPVDYDELASMNLSDLLSQIIRDPSVALEIDQTFEGNIRQIAGNVHLATIKGLGTVRVNQLRAACELGRRLATSMYEKKAVSCPADVARLMMPKMRDFQQEVVLVLCLDTKNNITHHKEIFRGTLNASVLQPREIFRYAVEQSAASIIMVHNHPSGDPRPSREDVQATQQMVRAGNYLQIPVRDHIIIGDGQFYSLKEERDI